MNQPKRNEKDNGDSVGNGANGVNEDIGAGVTGDIGLAFSGGGTRAIAFHLGVLAYLDSTELLDRLKMISTVSGGTATGAKFVLSLARGIEFQEFFKDFYAFIRDVQLVKLGFKAIADGKTAAPSGRKNLIISMAQVYSDHFFENPDGGPTLFSEILGADIPLEEVIFNTTEFRYGGDFRFHRSLHFDNIFGSLRIPILMETVGKIRLADIVAASSCVPVGFEPIAYPDDFVWPGGEVPPPVREKFKKPLPLMDGGVYDNGGVENLVESDKKHGYMLDAVFISDAAPEPEAVFEMPKPEKPGKMTLGGLSILAWIIMVVAFFTAGVSAYRLIEHFGQHGPIGDFFIHLVPMALAILAGGSLWWLREFVGRNVLSDIPQVGEAAWEDLKRLKVTQVEEMVKLRLKPVVDLTSTIFTDRISRLVYEAVDTNPQYEKKRIKNRIFDLKTGRPFFPELGEKGIPPGVEKPSKALHAVADIAATMPTLFWFDENYKQPCLVAAGQFTACYNLMRFVVMRRGSDPQKYPPDVKAVWDRLVSDWNEMVKDPYALLKKRLPDTELPVPPKDSNS